MNDKPSLADQFAADTARQDATLTAAQRQIIQRNEQCPWRQVDADTPPWRHEVPTTHTRFILYPLVCPFCDEQHYYVQDLPAAAPSAITTYLLDHARAKLRYLHYRCPRERLVERDFGPATPPTWPPKGHYSDR